MIARIATMTMFMLLAPLASAGGVDATLRYLDGESGCSEHSYGYSDFNWYYYESSSSCRDGFDYASAAIEGEGQAAEAGVGARDSHDNAYSSWWYGGDQQHNDSAFSWWGSGGSESTSSGWFRGAWISAGGASATAGYGCASTTSTQSSGSGHSSWWRNGDGSSASWSGSDHAYNYTHAEECGERATLRHGNSTLSAGRVDGCRQSQTGRSSDSSSSFDGQSSGSSTSQWEDAHVCGTRAVVAGPASADAGTESGCRSEGHEGSAYWHDNQSSWQDAGSSSWSECLNGASAHGPDGARVFAGRQDWSAQSCHGAWDQQVCEQASGYAWIAGVSWSHGPLGPHDQTIYLPLP